MKIKKNSSPDTWISFWAFNFDLPQFCSPLSCKDAECLIWKSSNRNDYYLLRKDPISTLTLFFLKLPSFEKYNTAVYCNQILGEVTKLAELVIVKWIIKKILPYHTLQYNCWRALKHILKLYTLSEQMTKDRTNVAPQLSRSKLGSTSPGFTFQEVGVCVVPMNQEDTLAALRFLTYCT